MPSSSDLISLPEGAVFYLIALSVALFWLNRRTFSTPAGGLRGPPSLPIIGNLFQVPVRHPWVRFANWKKIYGDVVPVKIFGRRLVVLNSRAAAVELFEKRSAIYSERPPREMAQLSGLGKSLLFSKYGDRVRKTRKQMHSEIGPNVVQQHRELQEREVQHFVHRIIQSDKNVNLFPDSKRLAASITFMISYGYQVKGPNDPLVKLAEGVMGYLDEIITPNRFLVDSLPILRYIPDWFPGASFKQKAKKCRDLVDRLMNEPYEMVRNDMKHGTALSSFVSRNLEGRIMDISEDESDILMWTAGGIYAGGAHSTVAVIMTFFLTMVLHPDVQYKAQKELDAVLFKGRLPKLTDRASLPYIECILKEVYRWRPVAPLTAHSTLVDDVYEGSIIPAGSVIMANAWAFAHDEDVFDDPDEFSPDRFLSPDTPDPRTMVFGFGRRICPGLHLVDNLLWIVIATTLATVEILPALDKRGAPKFPSAEYTSGAVSQPLPFQCRILPRSAHSRELVSDAVASWT